MSVVAASVLGLGLGLKHAFEADHVAAVCTFVARGGTVARAAWSGAIWGLGHGLMIVVVGGGLVATGATVPPSIALALDVAVAVMLVGLGIGALVSRGQAQPDEGAAPKTVKRPLAVGLVHGASGTAALTMLVASTMQVRATAFVFVMVFGLASILGMALIAALVAWPVRSLSHRAPSLGPRLQALAGLGSIAAGIAVALTVL